MPTKKAGGFEYAVDAPRVVPTGQGRYAYVMGVDGKTVQYRVSDPAFVEALRQFVDTPAMRQTLPVVRNAAASFGSDGWVQALAVLDPSSAPADDENA
jgi:hypothetical protein